MALQWCGGTIKCTNPLWSPLPLSPQHFHRVIPNFMNQFGVSYNFYLWMYESVHSLLSDGATLAWEACRRYRLRLYYHMNHATHSPYPFPTINSALTPRTPTAVVPVLVALMPTLRSNLAMERPTPVLRVEESQTNSPPRSPMTSVLSVWPTPVNHKVEEVNFSSMSPTIPFWISLIVLLPVPIRSLERSRKAWIWSSPFPMFLPRTTIQTLPSRWYLWLLSKDVVEHDVWLLVCWYGCLVCFDIMLRNQVAVVWTER